MGKKKTKADLEKEILELKSEIEEASAGASRAPLGASAGPPLYVRVSRTFKWAGNRVGAGVVVINPDLSLLRAGHGNWGWVHKATWDACKRKSCCSEGQVVPWVPPGQ